MVACAHNRNKALPDANDYLQSYEGNKSLGEKQAEMELKAATLLASIREIKDLYGAGFGTSYQIQNLVHRLKENVEFIEEAGGDVFII